MESISQKFPTRRIAHAIALLLGLILAAWAFSLGLGSVSRPGPGLWPFMGACTMALSAIYLIFRERSDGNYESFTWSAHRVGIALVLLAISAMAFALMGLIIAATILLLSWLVILGRETLKTALLVTAVGVFVTYLVFGLFLGIPFPDDIVLDLIGV